MRTRVIAWAGELAAVVQDRMARSDAVARSHARIFRLSGGRIGSEVQGRSVLLLATTGRRTGQRRENVLMYVRHEGSFLVVPSNAADPERPPAWWRNLRADPRAQALVDGAWLDVEAAALSPDERDRRWPMMVAYNPSWGRFQDEVSRRFPIVALRPVEG